MERKKRIRHRRVMLNRIFTIMIIVIVSFTIIREIYVFYTSNLHYEERLLEYRSSVLEQEISNRIDEINSIENELENEFRNELEHQISLVDHFATEHARALGGNPTLDEKREAYIDSIYQYDISEDEYLFFSFDQNGVSWLMGLDKSDEHSSIYNLQDPVTGRYFIRDMIEGVQASDSGEAFITYYWPKQVGGEPTEKTSYLYYNSEVDLIIGTGMYLDDYTVNVQEELFSRINAYYIDTEDYVFIFGYDGYIYEHGNSNFTTEFLLELQTLDNQSFHNYIVEELKDNQSLWIDYMGPDIDLNLVEKKAYVERIEEWDMYIGQGLFIEDIDFITQSYMQQTFIGLILSVFGMGIIATGFIMFVKKLIGDNFSDVQDEFKEQNEIIANFSLRDSLTGLFNRKYFDRAFLKFKNKNIERYSIIQGDANGLKLTNDAFGHDEGDKLLVKISTIITSVFDGDYVFRWGGDEFLILSYMTEKKQVTDKLKLFQETASEEKTLKVNVSVSFGYVLCDIKTDPYEEMKKAETMMYERKTLESTSTKRQIIDKILEALYGNYNFEEQHSYNVMENALKVGEMMGMNSIELSKLRLGALMHDIGKIGIPDDIITKPGKLTDSEYEEVKKHAEKGFRMLSAYPELSEYGYIVLHHHERYDGTGYPRKLKGEDIPLHSRIITVVDAYDAMIEERVYKKSLSKKEALEELVKCKGSQFDPNVVDVFVSLKHETIK